MLTHSSNNANINQCYIIILAQLHISPVNIDLSARDLKKQTIAQENYAELCPAVKLCKKTTLEMKHKQPQQRYQSFATLTPSASIIGKCEGKWLCIVVEESLIQTT